MFALLILEALKKVQLSNTVSVYKTSLQHTIIILFPFSYSNSNFPVPGQIHLAKMQIQECCILPLLRADVFASMGSLLSPPRGIMLYGPPGTGKTMLAKAIAKESGAFFINLRISTIQNKWFGESQKLVRALFTLAEKMAPTIIFVDEMDALLRQRNDRDQSHINDIKAEFMSQWDGLLSGELLPKERGESERFIELGAGMGYDDSQDREELRKQRERKKREERARAFGIMVVGATNRPHDVDRAILRRMPRQFYIGLPDVAEREQILRLYLSGRYEGAAKEEYAVDLDALANEVAMETEGYSGSDLRELVNAAAMIPVREFLAQGGGSKKKKKKNSKHDQVRALKLSDFWQAKQSVPPTNASNPRDNFMDYSRPDVWNSNGQSTGDAQQTSNNSTTLPPEFNIPPEVRHRVMQLCAQM